MGIFFPQQTTVVALAHTTTMGIFSYRAYIRELEAHYLSSSSCLSRQSTIPSSVPGTMQAAAQPRVYHVRSLYSLAEGFFIGEAEKILKNIEETYIDTAVS